LIVAAAANLFLFAVRQNLSSDREKAPSATRQVFTRAPARTDGLHAKPLKPGTATPSEKDKSELITVPISLYRRLSAAGARDFFDTETAALNASGKSVLGVDDATQNEISRALRSAADRVSAIQKQFARVTAAGEGWKIEIPPEAHDAKSASLHQLESELNAILPAEKAKLLSSLAGFYILLGNPKDTQTFTVKWSGGGLDFSTQSSAYVAGGMMILQIFRKGLQYSWIEDVVVKAGGSFPGAAESFKVH
jgi:hypothetical protein